MEDRERDCRRRKRGRVMIYEFKDTIVHLYKCFIHFFRALFCKDYFTESHGLGMCGQYGRVDAKGKYRFCEYRWCPKRKSNADNAFQHVESVESVERKESE